MADYKTKDIDKLLEPWAAERNILARRVAELEAERCHVAFTVGQCQAQVTEWEAKNAELRDLLRWFCNNTFIGRGIATTEYERIRELLSEPTDERK